MAQMAELTRTLREVSAKLPEKSIQVTVESLHVDKATLESLVFRMDSLDIHELSGSLNLGNNFGQTPDRHAKSVNQVRLGDGSASGPRTQRLTQIPIADGTTDGTSDAKGTQPPAVKLDRSKVQPQPPLSQGLYPVRQDSDVKETDRGYVIRFSSAARTN